MNAEPGLGPRQLKGDRNTHESSAEESRRTEPLDDQKRGGGYRSGSSGAGTSDHDAPARRAVHARPNAQGEGKDCT